MEYEEQFCAMYLNRVLGITPDSVGRASQVLSLMLNKFSVLLLKCTKRKEENKLNSCITNHKRPFMV